MTPVIRNATARDTQVLVEIERHSFANPHWDGDSFLKHSCVVAELEGHIVGFLVSRETSPGIDGSPPEREILNLAVARSYRRLGVATALLRHELNQRAMHFLEVRESNIAAQALYRKCGFVKAGYRPAYYESPSEAAIVMKSKKC